MSIKNIEKKEFVYIGLLSIVTLLIPENIVNLLVLIFIALLLIITLIVAINSNMKNKHLEIILEILLIFTLFKTMLNLAVTKILLINLFESAKTGNTIIGFGDFIIGDKLPIALIVFATFILLSHRIITQGSTLFSWKKTRFLVNISPDEHMAIDSELNAGVLNNVESQERRKKINKDTELYETIDGLSNFLKYDTFFNIAFILIYIIVGTFIGIFQYEHSLNKSIEIILDVAVGYGFIFQCLSFINFIIAFLIIIHISKKYRNSLENLLDKKIMKELMIYFKLMILVSFIIIFIAYIYNLEAMSISLIGICLICSGYYLYILSLKLLTIEGYKHINSMLS
ncbi:MAG: hypothetical protein GQ570_05155 [Helicobacteraceae bacterium]|nr:hypothetical protein [Helicobacteraceae bacterium]